MNLKRFKSLLISLLLLPVMPVFANQSKDPELLEIPGTEGVDGGNNTAVQSMIDIMGTNMESAKISQDIPLQNIAGMSGNEKTTQGLLSKFLGTLATESDAYKMGLGELKKTLGGEFYDPQKSDFWKGFRENSAMEEEAGIESIRRRGQLGGGLMSTTNAGIEARYVRGVGADRNMQLGKMYEKERDRRSAGIGQALGYAGFEEVGKMNRLNAGAKIGSIPRDIQNQKFTAEYNQSMGEMTAKNQQEQSNWNNQLANIGVKQSAASELMPQWNVDQGGGTSPLGGILGIVGSLVGK